MDTPTQPPAWHQALAYVVTGQRHPELGRQDRPDVAAVAAFLRDRMPDGSSPLDRPHQLPAELAADIGAAQLGAGVSALRTLLARGGEDGTNARPSVPVLADRPLSADEQRLLREVPPHHGS